MSIHFCSDSKLIRLAACELQVYFSRSAIVSSIVEKSNFLSKDLSKLRLETHPHFSLKHYGALRVLMVPLLQVLFLAVPRVKDSLFPPWLLKPSHGSKPFLVTLDHCKSSCTSRTPNFDGSYKPQSGSENAKL